METHFIQRINICVKYLLLYHVKSVKFMMCNFKITQHKNHFKVYFWDFKFVNLIGLRNISIWNEITKPLGLLECCLRIMFQACLLFLPHCSAFRKTNPLLCRLLAVIIYDVLKRNGKTIYFNCFRLTPTLMLFSAELGTLILPLVDSHAHYWLRRFLSRSIAPCWALR